MHFLPVLVLDVHVRPQRRSLYELPRANLALQLRLSEVRIVGFDVLLKAGIVPVGLTAELARVFDGFTFVHHLIVFVGGALRSEHFLALPAPVVVPLEVDAVDVSPQGVLILQSPSAEVAVAGILLEMLQSLVVVHHVQQREFLAAYVAGEHFFVVHIDLVFVQEVFGLEPLPAIRTVPAIQQIT